MKSNKKQLFLLHFAGGNCYSFQFLKPFLSQSYDVYSLELPGRGNRMSENIIYNKSEAILDYVRQIKKLRNNNDFVIYGHSMGAILGLSVINEMELSGDYPLKFISSGNAGPGVRLENEIDRYLLDDVNFKIELQSLGGIPIEILNNKELFDFFTPLIKADYEVLEKEKSNVENFIIKTPIHVVMGSTEKYVSFIDNWRKFSTKDITTTILTGNHFFIFNHPEKLAQIINE